MKLNEMTPDLERFLERMIKQYSERQRKRFPEGVKKYGTHIVNDYSPQDHIANIKEELGDADAYLSALEVHVREMEVEIEQLQEENLVLRKRLEEIS